MNRGDIIRMARDAWGLEFIPESDVPKLERFAALVAAEEREACIKVIEAYRIPVGNSPAGELACDWTYEALKQIRDEIRERGEK